MIRAGFLTALALALAPPVAAQSPPEWRPVTAETGQIRDTEGLEELSRAFPDSGSVRVRLFQAQIREGKIDAALQSLGWLNLRGYVFGAGAQAQILELFGDVHAKAARDSLVPEAEAIESSEVIGEFPAEAGLIETVLVPEGSSVILGTSITTNALYTIKGSVQLPPVVIPGASDLSGLIEESDRSMGWVASSNLDESEASDPLFAGLIGLTGDLNNPVFVPAPQGASVSDLAIGADETVFASDPINGGVYQKSKGDLKLTSLVEPGTFRSPQGLAVSEDGTRLYVSDYRYGLAVIDLETRALSRLISDVPVLLDGVDGLWIHKSELIAVQNGTSPMRISAFMLSEDGTRITGHRVLEQAHSEWTEPLGGSISGDTLVYVGTGQWDRYDKGVLREGVEAIPTQIRRLLIADRTD